MRLKLYKKFFKKKYIKKHYIYIYMEYVLMKSIKVTLKLLVLNNKDEGYFCPNKNIHFC